MHLLKYISFPELKQPAPQVLALMRQRIVEEAGKMAEQDGLFTATEAKSLVGAKFDKHISLHWVQRAQMVFREEQVWNVFKSMDFDCQKFVSETHEDITKAAHRKMRESLESVIRGTMDQVRVAVVDLTDGLETLGAEPEVSPVLH